ncbi:unnamed protein product [Gongylonema pulchrum]|uniref:Uncharacterized protein n=1 Tax=Gongylonema pulchrum TaxID=637853 RepID=A0A183D421_9BILA|nr:unnamed protein product [Gongylonema pulchrum]
MVPWSLIEEGCLRIQVKVVLSIKWENRHYHFEIKQEYKYFWIEEIQSDSIVQLLAYHFINKVSEENQRKHYQKFTSLIEYFYSLQIFRQR